MRQNTTFQKLAAWVLTFAMLITSTPMTAFAAGGTEPTVLQSSTMENQNQAGGVVYTKTSTAKSDGTIDITLTAHTTGEVRQTSKVTPTDIVLVLDVSGSMDDNYTTAVTDSYNAANGSQYTYRTGSYGWGENRTGYGFNNNRSNLYINTGTAADPVYTAVTYTGRDANGFEIFEYNLGTTEVMVYPALSGSIGATRSHSYSVVQFYRRQVTTQTVQKMELLQDAVKSFIDTTATMNEGLADSDMHTISIVKFAGNRYANNTSDTLTLTEGNGTYSSGYNRYNYSQVVKGLLPVNAANATVLKDAVDDLSPGGATSADYGLRLAEAVLLNRSAVVERGAVDRNEVVIVFTDGDPNHNNGFDTNVANTCIEIAGNLEQDAGVKVYGVCIADDADATDISVNINKFMHYLTSNYPNATSMSNAGTGGSMDNGYYMTPDSSTSLSMIFESIIQNIDHPSITLGEEATMVDTISPYFNFKGDVSSVKLQTQARKSDGTWADPVDDAHLQAVISGDVLTVEGFDFDSNFISAEGRGASNDFYGKRLVVSFTVTPDYGVIDAASVTLMDGILPTNTGFALLEDGDSTPAAEVESPLLSTHQVTYVVDGVTYASYNRFTGSDITVAVAPVKAGHTFSGWTYPSGLGVSGGAFIMPDQDVVITGSFTANDYNVSYVYSGQVPAGAPAVPATAAHTYGSTVTVSQAPVEVPGYVFSGWAPLDTELAVTADGRFTMPAHDVVLRGVFTPGTATPYKIEHYLEKLDGSGYDLADTENKTGTTGEEAVALPKYYEGFTYDSANAANVVSGTIAASGDLVLKLHYDRNEYEVTYAYAGDIPAAAPAAPATVTYKYGQEVTVAADASATGYTFEGWESLSTSATAGQKFIMPAHAVAFVGEWDANDNTPYKVEYYLESLTDGVYDLNAAASYSASATTGSSVEASVKTFPGFTYNAAASTVTGTVAPDGSLVLKLYYDRNTYSVTYEYDGGLANQPSGAPAIPGSYQQAAVKYGETVTVAPDLSLTGYSFDGWISTDLSVKANDATFVMPAKDMVLLGDFEPAAGVRYREEHYLQNLDGTYNEADPYYEAEHFGTTGDAVSTSPMNPTGFSFNAVKSGAVGGVVTGTIAPDGSTVLKFYYDRNTYSVLYQYDGEQPAGAPAIPSGYQKAAVKYGETVTVEADLALTGYVFDGWYPADLDLTVGATFVMPAHNVTLLGCFEPAAGVPYKEEHYLQQLNGAYTSVPQYSIDHAGTTGETVDAVAMTIPGYTFDAGNAKNITSAVVAPDGSTVLRFYYERNGYKVTYKYDGSQPAGAPAIPDSYQKNYVKHGTTLTVEPALSLPGYVFDGWYPADLDLTVGATFVMPTKDVVLLAHFDPASGVPYKEEHYLQKLDGTYPAVPDYSIDHAGTTGETVDAVSMTIPGYTFDSGNANNIVSATVKGDGSTVLRFYYERNTYDVIYAYDGTQPAGAPALPAGETDVMVGETVTLKPDLSMTGYDFVGWYPTDLTVTVTGDQFAMPDHAVTLLGRFEPASGVAWKEEHYLQKLDGTYSAVPDYSTNHTGTTDETVSVVHMTIPGYTFDAANTNNITSAVVKGDGSTVLKFYYERNAYTVTYAYDGAQPAGAPGLPGSQTDVLYGEEVTVAPDLTLIGYNFVGWYTQDLTIDASSGKFDMPSHNVTLLGRFEPNLNTKYREEHYLQKLDGTYEEVSPWFAQDHYGTTGDTVTEDALDPSGYTYNAGHAQGLATSTIKADGTTVLKFYYDRNTYDVVYAYDGIQPAGAPSIPAGYGETDVMVGAEVVVEPGLTLTGYTFTGWYTQDLTLDASSGKFDMPDHAVTLLGRFEPALNTPYKQVHYLQKLDGTYDLANPYFEKTHYGTTGETVSASAMDPHGYTFNETKSGASGGLVSATIDAAGTTVLKFYYDRNKHDVTYAYDGLQPAGAPALPAGETGVTVGAEITVKPDLSLTGYIFNGWYTADVTIDAADGTFDMPDHDVTLLAKFEPAAGILYREEHYLETMVDGQYEAAPFYEKSHFGTTGDTASATAMTPEGFTYNSGISTPSATIAPDGTTVLKFYYDRNSYTVSYEYRPVTGQPDGAAALLPLPVSYQYGQVVEVEDPLALTGYNFEGWFPEQVITISGGQFLMPAEDVVLVGDFEARSDTKYVVHHHLQDANGNYSVTPDYTSQHTGTTGATVTALVRNFAGYVHNSSAPNTVASGVVKADGSLQLELYYDRTTFNVTYFLSGAVPSGVTAPVDSNSPYRHGATVTVLPVLTAPDVPAGYHFVGWTPVKQSAAEDNITINGNQFVMPMHNVRLEGVITANVNTAYRVEHYIEKLDVNNDYELYSGETRYGTTGSTVSAYALTIHGFTNVTAAGGVVVDKLEAQIAGDGSTVIKFYYDRNEYEVTYTYEGKTPAGVPAAPAAVTVPFGKEVTVEAVPSVPGYSFIGWNTGDATVSGGKFTMPDQDVAFTGKFQSNQVTYTVNYWLQNLDAKTTFDAADYTLEDTYTENGFTGQLAMADRKIYTGFALNRTQSNPQDYVTVDASGTGNLVLNLYFDRHTFKVTYAYYGQQPAGVPDLSDRNLTDVRYGTELTVAAKPTFAGHIFDGWYTNTADVDNNKFTMPDHDVTFLGRFQEEPYVPTPVTPTPTPGALNGDDHFAYVVGYPDGTVQPNGNITRAEATVIFFRLLKEEVRVANLNDQNDFADVAVDDWFNIAVSTMQTLNIVSGRAEGGFDPNAFITRAEFAAICARFDDSEFEVVDTFTDVEGHWAEDEIHEAAAHGWITGYEDNTFKPNQYITRAEAMTLINRVLNRLPETVDDLLPDAKEWPDCNDPSLWYYLPVQEATHSHKYTKRDIYEKWIELQEGTDWLQYQ